MMLTNRIEKTRTAKGIGLLELMLALAIISILIIMATRYYQTTSRSQKVAEAVTQANAVIAGAARWRIGKAGYDGLTIGNLSDLGLLPREMEGGVGINPWGGDIVMGTSTGGTLIFSFTQVDSKDCASLVSMFGGTSGTSNIKVTQTANTCLFTYSEKQS